MSELKVYHCNEWHNEYTEFYLKSEADKYIKELKGQNHELCQALHSMYSEEEMNYQKYKRCLAMAIYCHEKSLWWYSKGFGFEKYDKFWEKWENRWLAMAKSLEVVG